MHLIVIKEEATYSQKMIHIVCQISHFPPNNNNNNNNNTTATGERKETHLFQSRETYCGDCGLNLDPLLTQGPRWSRPSHISTWPTKNTWPPSGGCPRKESITKLTWTWTRWAHRLVSLTTRKGKKTGAKHFPQLLERCAPTPPPSGTEKEPQLGSSNQNHVIDVMLLSVLVTKPST